MHLTKRFFLMNALTVLLSTVLTVLVVIVFVAVYTNLLGREAHIHEWKRVYEVRTAMTAIKREAQAAGYDKLLDPLYQQELSERMKIVGGDAIVAKNREVLYSSKVFREIDIEKSLILSENAAVQDTIELDGRTYLFASVSYQLPSGDDVVFLLLAPTKLNTGFYIVLGMVTVGFFVLIFFGLNLWVSYTFSRGIIMPVMRLKDAAVKISQGDLNQGIAEEGEGEVRELSRTLEWMRLKLKESIYMQQRYDENRAFLVSSISHDLKTPVTSIIGYIDGVLDGVAATPEKRQAYLETVRSKALLVNTMIDDLLLYSKLDLNQLPYHFERIDLFRYFEDCFQDHRLEFERAGIVLTLISELREPVRVLMDRERFRRVVQNILSNAAYYCDNENGRVVLLLRETRTSAIVEIKDNGMGIPEKDLPYIFDRFYRADLARRNTEGSGLGLAIAKQIVEGHEGKIWAASAEGEGTRMMISLKKL